MDSVPVPTQIVDAISALGIEPKPEQVEMLGRYLALLLDVNQRVNLTAIRDQDAAWMRLIIDSLTVVPFLDEQGEGELHMIDVGTGGGLPGLPVAIVRPQWQVVLLDATGKKVDAVQSFIDALELTNAKAIQGRAEDIGHDRSHRENYDVALCRGVGPMAELLEYTMPLVRNGGALLAMKGPKVKEELDHAGDALTELGGGDLAVYDAYPQGFENDLVMVWVSKSGTTPKAYPRQPGIPKREPLGSVKKNARPSKRRH